MATKMPALPFLLSWTPEDGQACPKLGFEAKWKQSVLEVLNAIARMHQCSTSLLNLAIQPAVE